VEPVADDAPLGTDNVEVDGADARPDDDAKGLRRNLVVHGVDPSTPGFTALGDAALAPGFYGVMGPGVARLLLLDSLG
jgi:hypothetical protein